MTLPALWFGKLLIACLRLLGRGASTLPGRLAARAAPDLLPWLATRTAQGSVVVTGTNGKTTTATLLAGAAAAAGDWRITHNRSGANLASGLTTAFIAAAGWSGRGRDLAVCEVDEATVPYAVGALRPRVAVVTNFFRDQLDRYGELATAVERVGGALRMLAPDAIAVLNADDPLVAGLATTAAATPTTAAAAPPPGTADFAAAAPTPAGHPSAIPCRRVFFGIECDLDTEGDRPRSAAPSDAAHCPACGSVLRYDAVHYAHLGHYRCPGCGWRRPDPEVALTAYRSLGLGGSQLRIRLPGAELELRLGLGGLYNAYNALAAAGAAYALGLPAQAAVRAFAADNGAFGRMEPIAIGDKEAVLLLVKNPVGLSEALRAVLDDAGEGKLLLIAINDLAADGRDVSWLWDADVEQLAVAAGVEAVVASGLRAEDMGLRLKYAGLDAARLIVEPDLGAALRLGLERLPPGGRLYVLPSYTAMLQLRGLISRQGYARRFWEV